VLLDNLSDLVNVVASKHSCRDNSENCENAFGSVLRHVVAEADCKRRDHRKVQRLHVVFELVALLWHNWVMLDPVRRCVRVIVLRADFEPRARY